MNKDNCYDLEKMFNVGDYGYWKTTYIGNPQFIIFQVISNKDDRDFFECKRIKDVYHQYTQTFYLPRYMEKNRCKIEKINRRDIKYILMLEEL